MYQLLQGRSLKSLSIDALPPLAVAFIVAELFYKWHSFTLECAGFLATWFALDFAWTQVLRRLRASDATTAH